MGNDHKLLDDIKEAYGSWNKARRRIADLILKDPARCSFLSIREFASLANTTDVTVINFCKSLGYSYSEFKKELQNYVLEWSNPSERMKIIASSSDDAVSLYAKIGESERFSVEEAFRMNSVEKIMSANEVIRNSSKVFLASHNASRLATNYLEYRFSLLGVDMRPLDLAEEHQSMSLLEEADAKKSLLISIATPPYGKATLAITKLAKHLGFSVITFSDDSSCPFNEDSDLAFVCPSLRSFGGLTNSYVPYMALFDAMAFFYYFGRNVGESEDVLSKLKSDYKTILDAYDE